MKSFGITDRGTVRADNQDSFVIEKCDSRDSLVVALCDGMGGAKAGGVASQIANKAFVSHIFAKLAASRSRIDFKHLLTDACTEANGVAYEYSHFGDEFTGMGTTIVGGVVRNNGKAYLINVGDSRAYLISRRDITINQVTRDHSLVEELVECGVITKEQARTHPQKNLITRALGSESRVECDYFEVNMQSGDTLLLCSDGLSNVMTDDELLDAALKTTQPQMLCRMLMDEVLSRGAGDNVTVVAVIR